MIFFDLKKAFDSVPIRRLLLKLERAGISGQLLRWIESFLSNRKQRVKFGSCFSDWNSVLSGVPQGSVLGPVLFIIFVNDCTTAMESEAAMFADDLKIWREIRSPADRVCLQNDVDRLQAWTRNWRMSLNASKTVVMKLSSRPTLTVDAHYHLDGEMLTVVEQQTDLGVTLHHTLKPSAQCAKAAKRAMGVMRQIKRSFIALTPRLFERVYGCFVRPHLEYSVQAWRPWLKKDQKVLEDVQRRSSKLVQGLKRKSYEERLEILKLPPLNFRFDRADLLLAYKMIRGTNPPLRPSDFFENSRTPWLRGHPFKLQKGKARLDLRRAAFSQRIVDKWNKLPIEVVSAPSSNLFAQKLNSL